jgi:hypothetical protein
MITLNFTNDETVKRLRLVMFGIIIFDMVNTLAGQPDSFWHNAQTAIRSDGLSINNPTNYMFMLFLGSGWLAYTFAVMACLIVALLLVSVLPKKAALITILAFIFGYYFDAGNWLAVRWHLGLQGPFFLGIALALSVGYAAFPANVGSVPVKNLRWIMLLAMLTDATITLIGQPKGYWHNPTMVDEGNPLSRFFLAHGWYAYLLEQTIICSALYRLIAVLSKRWGVITALGFTFAGFIGASNWFFYRFIWGMQAPVIFGALLSAAIVLLAFHPRAKRVQTDVMDEIPVSTRDGKSRWRLRECF